MHAACFLSFSFLQTHPWSSRGPTWYRSVTLQWSSSSEPSGSSNFTVWTKFRPACSAVAIFNSKSWKYIQHDLKQSILSADVKRGWIIYKYIIVYILLLLSLIHILYRKMWALSCGLLFQEFLVALSSCLFKSIHQTRRATNRARCSPHIKKQLQSPEPRNIVVSNTL